MNIQSVLYKFCCPSVLLTLAAMTGCGSEPTEATQVDGPQTRPEPKSAVVYQSIGPQGGTISLADGFEMVVPAGALSTSVELSVERWETSIPFAAGPAYLLGPEGLTFELPVTLQLPVNNEGLSSDTKRLLTAYWSPKGVESFKAAEQAAVERSSVLTETTHFSVWMAGEILPQVVATNEQFPRGIATDGTHLYWANGGNALNQLTNTNQGFIARAPVGGGAVELVTPPQEDPQNVAVNDQYIYWTNGGDGVEYGGEGTGSAVMRMAKTGNTPERLSSEQFAVGLALDDSHVYYTDADLGEIRRIPLDGGSASTIASGQGNASHISVDASHAVWTSAMLGQVVAYDKQSGAVSVLATGAAAPAGVVVRDGFVYWVNEGDGLVSKVSTAGGPITVLRNAKQPAAIAVAGDNVVFTDLEDSSVYAVSKTDGVTTILATNQWVPWNVAEHNGTVVWTNAGSYSFEGAVVGMSLW